MTNGISTKGVMPLMWKERYRLGNEKIDAQHIQLFKATEKLIGLIEAGADSASFVKIIQFLKAYVIQHFKDEEEFQRSINYSGFKAHQQAHRAFTQLVFEYEKKLVASNMDIGIIKELAGILTSWLIYHVVNTDMKIIQGAGKEELDEKLPYINVFLTSLEDTLQAIGGIADASLQEYEDIGSSMNSDVDVVIGVFGDINGIIQFNYTKELALNLLENMIFSRPESIDELVCSALGEIANITAGNSSIRLAKMNVTFDIKPPMIITSPRQATKGGIIIETGIGKLKVAVELDKYI